MAAKTAKIDMVTRSSISVKPDIFDFMLELWV